MEVGTLSVTCNNEPAESTSPENDGARATDLYLTVVAEALCWCQATTSRRVVMVSVDGEGADLARASISADLGGSSNYTSENLVD